MFKSDADSRSRGHNIKRDLSLSFERPKVHSPHRFPEQYGDQLSLPGAEALPSSHTTELSAGQSIPDLRGSKVKMTSVHITMPRIILHSKADVDSPWTDGRRILRLKRYRLGMYILVVFCVSTCDLCIVAWPELFSKVQCVVFSVAYCVSGRSMIKESQNTNIGTSYSPSCEQCHVYSFIFQFQSTTIRFICPVGRIKHFKVTLHDSLVEKPHIQHVEKVNVLCLHLLPTLPDESYVFSGHDTRFYSYNVEFSFRPLLGRLGTLILERLVLGLIGI